MVEFPDHILQGRQYLGLSVCFPVHQEPSETIKKTSLYNFDPLKPHFYKVNGVYGLHIIFRISAKKNIDCWYSLEPPRRGGSNEYPQSMF